MCADTGLPRFYVKLGDHARFAGGFTGFERALRSATARATHDIPLRPNRVHPLWRTDHNNNVGINAPEIEWSFEPDVDWIEITTVHKGGLFGTDYRMLFPGDGIDGIKRFFLDTLVAFGKRGLACQPAIVGVGLGGSKDTCMVLGKQAACLRVVGDRNPDPEIAALEEELQELGNSIGMGAMGFVGKSMVADCHIEVGYTHTGGMPMSNAHVLPVFAPGHGADTGGRFDGIPYRPQVVHPPTCDGRQWNGRPRTRFQDSPAEGAGQRRGPRGPRHRHHRLPRRRDLHRPRGRLPACPRGRASPSPGSARGQQRQLSTAPPAAAVEPDGRYKVGGVTATASFRFAKWMADWFRVPVPVSSSARAA